MKLYVILFITLFGFNSLFALNNNKEDPNELFEHMLVEMATLNKSYALQKQRINFQIAKINQKLLDSKNLEDKVDLLINKDILKEKIAALKVSNANDISKIRYLKGLQIIRLLYEKVLSLDHHFASVRTFAEINKIANPNQYPEFEKLKTLVNTKKDKKQGFDLTSILGTNPLVSVISTFSNMVVSGLTKEEKESELNDISCILDFTLRMQNDLNTIYFETAFLTQSNETIKEAIESLFRDYTKPIGYATALKECRGNDDWDSISKNLTEFLEQMEATEGNQALRMRIDVEFPVDRLLQFITQYNNFIDEGEKFYQKFHIILNSYENEQNCQGKLPIEYSRLKQEVSLAIEKFNVAYKPVEINGSRLKEIIYGISEF